MATNPAIVAEIEALLSGAPSLSATRYFAIAGLVAVLWEHLLTLPQELSLIWKGPIDMTKVIFFFNRYYVQGTLTYAVYVLCDLRPAMTDQQCRTYILFVTISSIVLMAMANLTITLRLQTLWDHRKHISIILVGGFLVTYSATVTFAGFVVRDLYHSVSYEPFIARTCIISSKPKFLPAVWAGMVAFDIFVFGLLLLNALNRPYRQNADVVSELHKDGLKFFLALLVIRLVNFVLGLTAGPAQTFLIVFFVWAMVSITLSRLLLRIESYKTAGQSVRVWKGDMFELARYD